VLDPYKWPRIVVVGTAPGAPCEISNTAWITTHGSAILTATSRLSDTEKTTIIWLADLEIDKVADPDPAESNETLTYTITVDNHGPAQAQNVVVVDELLAGLVGHGIDGDGWTCSAPGSVVTCTLGAPLAADSSTSFLLTTSAPFSGGLANLATVDSDTYDPEEKNNSVLVYTAVRPEADLVIAKSDDPDPVATGAPLTYTVTISNAGPMPAGSMEATLALTNAKKINIHWHGRATHYPSFLAISGAAGYVRNVTVTLNGLTHEYPADLTVLLVGPTEQGVVLMSNAGGGADANDVTLTINDAGGPMPISGTLVSGAVYQPTNYGIIGDLPNPAPEGPYAGSLSAFNGISPNGKWKLFVYDAVRGIGGEITDGWSLFVTTGTTDTVTLTDALPTGVTGAYVPGVPDGWVCGVAATSVTCEGTYVPVDGVADFPIQVTAPITGGVITNTAAVTSTVEDPFPDSNTVSITTTVLAISDLAIVKTSDPAGTVGQGAPLTYTLTISNAGPGAVAGPIVITDRLPMEISSVTPVGAGWGCDLSALPVLTCTLDTGLGVGALSQVHLLTTSAPITPGLVLTNTAGVWASAPDPIPTNNTSLVTITVGVQADVEIVKTGPAQVQPGDWVTYTLSVTNHGAGTTSVITVTDTISNATFFYYQVKPGWNCYGSAGWITCVYTDTLASGASEGLWLVAQAPAIVGTITNTARVESDLPDALPGNDTSTVYTVVSDEKFVYLPLVMRNYVPAPDLVVESIVAAGDAITVVVRNAGDRAIEAVFANEFWVDVYINPGTPPTSVNQTWQHVGTQGLVWGVTQDALPLNAGDAITLVVTSTGGDAYYRSDLSAISWPLPAGASIYAQADSAHEETVYGAIQESHEIFGWPYNNISGPVAVASAGHAPSLRLRGFTVE
jgi:uncharacterized repeat protein (TIGR01451 family)